MTKNDNSINHINEINTVTKGICDFFQHIGIFHSEAIGFPSYSKVRGRNVIEIPDDTPTYIKAWPVDNERTRDIAEAVHECEKLGRTLLIQDKLQEVKVLSRHFMIYGTTLPIRVAYQISLPKKKVGDGAKGIITESIYVKQMNLNRIFLGTLYHLATGRNYCMNFSESSIAEAETNGPTILEAYQKDHDFLSKPKVKRELVRLGVLAYFLSLYDMENGTNSILDPLKRFDVIDFDKGFWQNIPDPREQLVNPFEYQIGHEGSKESYELPYDKLMRHFKQGELESLVTQEMKRVYHNLRSNLNLFQRLVELMGTVEYYNLAAKEIYSEKDLVHYFFHRYEEFRPKNE